MTSVDAGAGVSAEDGRSGSGVGKLAAATPDTSGVVAGSSAGPATTPLGPCSRCGKPITDRTPPEGVTQQIRLTRKVTTWQLRFRRFHWRWLPADPRDRLRESYTTLDLCDWCAGDVFLFAQGLPPRAALEVSA